MRCLSTFYGFSHTQRHTQTLSVNHWNVNILRNFVCMYSLPICMKVCIWIWHEIVKARESNYAAHKMFNITIIIMKVIIIPGMNIFSGAFAQFLYLMLSSIHFRCHSPTNGNYFLKELRHWIKQSFVLSVLSWNSSVVSQKRRLPKKTCV